MTAFNAISVGDIPVPRIGVVEKVLWKMNLASKEDIARLEAKIRHIEQQKPSENKTGTSK